MALSQARASQRYEPKRIDKDRALTQHIYDLSSEHPRFGYRRITALLRRAGWQVNPKRVYRIWRREGLKMPMRKRKRKAQGGSENACYLRKATYPNEVWSYDFLMDSTESGHRLKILAVIDEYTRECLTLKVARSMNAEDVIDVLAQLIDQRGAPAFVRSDNGSEFIAHAVSKMLEFRGSETAFIAPGSPWENGYIESFNACFRDELLNREMFWNMEEACIMITRWGNEYNEERPHGSLDYMTPKEFAESERTRLLNTNLTRVLT
jgi:transposase InsO family protein